MENYLKKLSVQFKCNISLKIIKQVKKKLSLEKHSLFRYN